MNLPQASIIDQIADHRDELLNENRQLKQRIKRLEAAGNELRNCASYIGTVASGEGSVIRRTQEAIQSWDKEAKP